MSAWVSRFASVTEIIKYVEIVQDPVFDNDKLYLKVNEKATTIHLFSIF